MNWKTAMIAFVLLFPALVSAQVPPSDMQPEPTLGHPLAPVKMVMWADMNEPFSGNFYLNTFDQINSEYVLRGFVTFEFSNNILSFTPSGYSMAMAGECALSQGNTAFWKMLSYFYNYPGNFDRTYFINVADIIDLNMPIFASCIDTNYFAPEIEDDLLRASNLQVTASPTFFINDNKIIGAYQFSYFQGQLANAINSNQSCGEPIYISNNDPINYQLFQFNPQIDHNLLFWEEYDLGLAGSRLMFHNIGLDGIIRTLDDVEYEIQSNLTPNTLSLDGGRLAFIDNDFHVNTCSVPLGCDPSSFQNDMNIVDNSSTEKMGLDVDENNLVYVQVTPAVHNVELKFYNVTNGQSITIEPLTDWKKNKIIAKATKSLIVWQEKVLNDTGRVIGSHYRTYSPQTGLFTKLANKRFGKNNNLTLFDAKTISQDVTQTIFLDDLNTVIVADINNATGELLSIVRKKANVSAPVFAFDSISNDIYAISGGLFTPDLFQISNFSPINGLSPIVQYSNALNGRYGDFSAWNRNVVYGGLFTLVEEGYPTISPAGISRVMYYCE
jgi:protein-disulfide isomerase